MITHKLNGLPDTACGFVPPSAVKMASSPCPSPSARLTRGLYCRHTYSSASWKITIKIDWTSTAREEVEG